MPLLTIYLNVINIYLQACCGGGGGEAVELEKLCKKFEFGFLWLILSEKKRKINLIFMKIIITIIINDYKLAHLSLLHFEWLDTLSKFLQESVPGQYLKANLV